MEHSTEKSELLKGLLADHRSTLSEADHLDFETLHRRTRNQVMIWLTQAYMERFLWHRPLKEHYYTCISKCYNNQSPDAISWLNLQECVSKCKSQKQKIEELKQDVYYLSLFSLSNKMSNCALKFSQETKEFDDCEWTAHSKIMRRLKSYWPERYEKLTEKM